GGGLPVGAYGGSKAIMEQVAPSGPMYQAGTLSGNPLALAAGIATLKELAKPDFYSNLAQITQNLVAGIRDRAEAAKIPLVINQAESLFGIFFSYEPEIYDYAGVMRCDVGLFKQFFHAMLKQGIYLAPSAYETAFVSAAHTANEI